MEKKVYFFSIVIPTYNRPDRLRNCLESITKQNYPHNDFEVIVVDDGSPMSLETVVQPFYEQLNLRLITQTNSGPAKARNVGATQAQGKYIAFTDDDCEPEENWLETLAQGFAKFPEEMLGGHTINKLTDNIYSEASQLLIDYIYSYYNQESFQVSFFASNNMALSRDKFLEIGCFDTTFPLAAGEDRELCDRWLYYGHKMYFIPTAMIYHSHLLTLRTFCRQHLNYGRGAFYFHKIRGNRQEMGMKIEPLTFYWNLLIFPFEKVSLFRAFLMFVLLFLSQVFNVAGFFWEKLLFSEKKNLVLKNYN